MASDDYRLYYTNIPHVTFPDADGMEKYLRHEEAAWRALFESVKSSGIQPILWRNARITKEQLATGFQTLLANIEDRTKFNRLAGHEYINCFLPPPSTSIEGVLTLGLFDNARPENAMSVLLWFICTNLGVAGQQQGQMERFIREGEMLFKAGIAAEALPFGKASSQKVVANIRKAQSHVRSLDAAVKRAGEVNESHKTALTEIRDTLKARAKKLETIAVKREGLREAHHHKWVQETATANEVRIAEIEKKLGQIAMDHVRQQQEQAAEYEKLHDLFHAQLRLRAPVKLWETRAVDHKTASRTAFWIFAALTTAAVTIGIAAPFCFGDYIAASFFETVCDNAQPPNCQRLFSAKGPLTITGLLLVMSLVLWVTRLQYKVFLSERHLALDASEKRAFAETFLALKEGAEVDAANEAIVLASLFRPTQDGIIKDDETGVDLSAAAIIAKQLGRTP